MKRKIVLMFIISALLVLMNPVGSFAVNMISSKEV
ncbi:hypothetical protein N752_07680 [Desulforamulus aquiferis]|nr:hypothetical protein N752_07680 [Desulforamulus aquiferis]